jgi:outer membrane protein assembly factor BamA
VPRFGLVAVCLVACGGGAASVRQHKKGDEYLVAIRVEGLAPDTPLQSDDLVPRLGLQRNAEAQRSVDDYQLQLDTQRITGALQKLGYFAVDVKTRLDKPAGGDAVTLVFDVKLGKRATTHVDFVGLPDDVPVDAARAAVPLAEGAPFDYDAFDGAKETLQELLENSGYAHDRLEGNVLADRAHAKATLRYVFDPGPRVTFGAIKIIGADGWLADHVRARLKFEPGERYSRKALVDSQTAIYGMGAFATARVEADVDNLDPVVAIKVAVTPLELNEVSAGGGAGFDPFEYFLRARLTWLRREVLTPLTTSFLDFRPGYAFQTSTCLPGFYGTTCVRDFRGRVSETITQQDLILPELKADAEIGADYLTYEAFTKLAARGRLGLAWPIFTQRLQLRVGWQYSASQFPDVFIAQPTTVFGTTQTIDLGLDKTNYSGAYSANVVLDLRDKVVEPTLGAYIAVLVTKGTSLALGSFDYLQLVPELRLFAPLGPFVLAARGRLGTMSGQVPVTERFFGGGGSSHRGFGARELSPSGVSCLYDPAVPNGCPKETTSNGMTPLVIGGKGLLETSFEVRAPLGTVKGLDLGAVAFLDGGDVTLEPSQLSATNQRWAVGGTLRVLTPIGPVGVGLGYRLNRTGPFEPGGTGHINFVLAVGEAY